MAQARNRALSFAETYDGNGNVVVKEKLSCAHCQNLFDRPAPGEDVGFCHLCFAPVCLECGRLDACDPFERKLERMESRDRMLKSIAG